MHSSNVVNQMISKRSLYSDRTQRYTECANNDSDSIDDGWVILDDPNDGSESKSVIYFYFTQKNC